MYKHGEIFGIFNTLIKHKETGMYSSDHHRGLPEHKRHVISVNPKQSSQPERGNNS